MDKKTNTKDVLIALSIVLLLFGIWQFTAINKELELSQNTLQHIQTKIDQEKNQYKLQIDNLNANAKAANMHLETANQQLETTAKQLELAKTQLEKLNVLEADNANLTRIKQELEQEIAVLENERLAIEVKLHSLTELRKLVREVKTEIHEQNIQRHLVKKQQQKEIDAQEKALGNQGFIIKNRKNTYKTTIKIEVKPGS